MTLSEISPDHDLASMDVSDPALFQNDTWQPLFQRLRRECPVHYCSDSPYGPYWSITRYQDIMDVELNDAVFSSSAEFGGTQIKDNAGGKLPSFIRMDRPEHTGHRKTVAPIVGPKNLANIDDLIRSRTCQVLDALKPGEDVDWATQVSVPLTTMMLATLFAFPIEEHEKLTYWSDILVTNVGAPDALVETDEERSAIIGEMAAYFYQLFQERGKSEPGFDLISMMAHSPATKNIGGEEFLGTMALLIVGGNDTTRNSMTGSVLALHDNPEQNRVLREDPSLIPNFVHEAIRYQSPIIHMRRTAKEDAVVAGKQIAKGDKLVLWYASGNLDESELEDATKFDIQREKARRHLSFGAGIHRCVGDKLAEKQLQILWEEILNRKMSIEVIGKPVRIYSNFIRGIRSLPTRIHFA